MKSLAGKTATVEETGLLPFPKPLRLPLATYQEGRRQDNEHTNNK